MIFWLRVDGLGLFAILGLLLVDSGCCLLTVFCVAWLLRCFVVAWVWLCVVFMVLVRMGVFVALFVFGCMLGLFAVWVVILRCGDRCIW